jgi:hypothetical protein
LHQDHPRLKTAKICHAKNENGKQLPLMLKKLTAVSPNQLAHILLA